MPLRKRVSLAAAGAVAIAVAVAVAVCYSAVRSQLRGQIDSELSAQEQLDLAPPYLGPGSLRGLRANEGGAAPYEMYVSEKGQPYQFSGESSLQLRVTAAAKAVARDHRNNVMVDETVDGVHLRVLIFHAVAQGYATSGPYAGEEVTTPIAVELARPLTQVDNLLRNLRLVLALVLLGGIALAAALGRMAARRVLAPLAEVTTTTQTIGETDDLSLRLAVRSDDEVGQLATRFNEMLERLEESRNALDDSVRSQRQLVADASHELRTPVTSLRTNIEVLLAGGQLEEDERRRLLADVVEQSEELTTLVADLIDVARGDLRAGEMDDVRLDRIVEEGLARARRHSPDATFVASLHPVLVRGNPDRLMRAINNLLDNAIRHSAPSGPIEVAVDPSGVQVRDHGSGIDEADLPHIFDRFYRGANARALQGSGLGLAIVRQVAEQHGGSVSAINAPDGGALFTLSLPGIPIPAGGSAGNSDDDDEDGIAPSRSADGGSDSARNAGDAAEALAEASFGRAAD